MIGDLVRTRKGWAIEAPTRCPNGHTLTPGEMLVGFLAAMVAMVTPLSLSTTYGLAALVRFNPAKET
jgi:hypothetical protein